ncbi:class I SAM-dependent methyltransferase [Micromonospora chalcea]|uniref:class I SAM-dependent methyltransferase n=1 Tax=Micromonospora chalcea TaxID=1874 RepID=UPI003F49F24A
MRVSGIELSVPMVERLRSKADAATIPVVIGDMATATAPGEYSLVYLVYNTISNLLEQAEQVACFRNAARHLKPGGRFDRAGGAGTARTAARPAGGGLRDRARIRRRGHLRRAAATPRLAPLRVRRRPRGARLPQPAPLRLAVRAGPDGRVGRLHAGASVRGLVRRGVHRRIALPRVDLPAPGPTHAPRVALIH